MASTHNNLILPGIASHLIPFHCLKYLVLAVKVGKTNQGGQSLVQSMLPVEIITEPTYKHELIHAYPFTL